MNADLFLQQFGYLAQGEGGIKKLRDVILQLAVRGKLVEQNPTDEPAEVLLKKIEAEKKRLVKEGVLKKTNDKIILSSEKSAFRNNNWSYVSIESIWYTLSPIQKIKNSDFLEKGKHPIVDQGKSYIAGYTNSENLLIKIPHPIIVFGDHTKAIKYIDFDFCPGADGTKIIVPIIINPRYFYTYLKSLDLDDRGYGRHFKILKQQIIPLPPLAEQKRIVAKVDELMALCDKLEAEQKTQRTLKTHAVQSTLHHLTNAESPASFGTSLNILQHTFGNWFDDLATVKHLRATILQLAVQGKLVPQNPADEPASELLIRIEAEKKRLVKEGKIGREKILPIENTDHLFPLPQSWQWTRLQRISSLITSGSRDWAKYYSSQGAIFVRMGNLSKDSYRMRLHSLQYVSPPQDGEGSRTKLQEDDLLISITGDVGMLGLVPANFGEAYINQHTCLLRLLPDFRNRYVAEFLRTPTAKQQFDAPQRGIKNSFRLGDVGEIFIPLPPLTEQKRIVAKVDELMTLCDRLEAHITHTQTLNTHLIDSLIHRMTEAA